MSSASGARYAQMSDPTLNDQFRRGWNVLLVPVRPDRITGPERPSAPAHPWSIHAGPRHRAPVYRTARAKAAAQVSAR